MTKNLLAKAVYTDGLHKDITQSATWATQNADSVQISSTGQITAKAIGTSQITVLFEQKTAIANVMVTQKTLDRLALTPKDATFPKGLQAQYKVTGYYTDASFEDLSANAQWTAENTQTASIDAKGKLTAHSEGSTQITATVDDKSTQTTVTVTQAQLQKLSIIPKSSELDFIIGEQRTLSAVGLFTDGEAQDMTQQVSWVSFSPTVLSITPEGEKAGLATAESVGSAKITVTHPETQITGSDTYQIKNATLDSISIAPLNPVTPCSNQIDFVATGHFSDGKLRDVSEDTLWTSSECSIAEISDNGKVTTKTLGTATITASLLHKSASTSIQVVDPSQIKEIIVTPNPATAAPVSATFFTAKAVFMDGSELDVTKAGNWQSSEGIIATISNTICLHGRAWAGGAKGTATISNTYKGVTGTAVLTVK